MHVAIVIQGGAKRTVDAKYHRAVQRHFIRCGGIVNDVTGNSLAGVLLKE